MADTKTAVTSYIRAWVIKTNKDGTGENFASMASRLDVSKTALLHIKDGSRGVGVLLEENFAKLFFRGSVDQLRRAAHKFQRAQERRTKRGGPSPERAA